MKPVLARIDSARWLSILARHRKTLGLQAGGPVVAALEGGEVRIRTVAAVMAELQAEAARLLSGPEDSVNAFLAERRAEAAWPTGGASDRHPPTEEQGGGDDGGGR